MIGRWQCPHLGRVSYKHHRINSLPLHGVSTNQVVRRTDKLPIRSHVIVPVQYNSALRAFEAVKVILLVLYQETALCYRVLALGAFIEGGLLVLGTIVLIIHTVEVVSQGLVTVSTGEAVLVVVVGSSQDGF